jgi:hypothetical protein
MPTGFNISKPSTERKCQWSGRSVRNDKLVCHPSKATAINALVKIGERGRNGKGEAPMMFLGGMLFARSGRRPNMNVGIFGQLVCLRVAGLKIRKSS